jgi:citrate lyase subunit beta/citryl-CoA lyase
MSKDSARPIRSVLWAAGHDREGMRAALGAGADAVVIDLEEPRMPFPETERAAARQVVRETLESRNLDEPPLVFVRVQSPSTGQTLRDLRAVVTPSLTGVLVPKVEGPADIHAMDALLTCMEDEVGLDRGSVAIYPILETAQALRLAYEIGVASPRVAYMGGAISRFGDIYQALGYHWTPGGQETLFIGAKVLLDARAAGIRYPVSGMWGGSVDDLEGFRSWAEQIRDLGYRGMMIASSAHIEILHELFTPSEKDVAYWRELDVLATEAQKSGVGPVVHQRPEGDEFVVHEADIGSARMNLAWAEALGIHG